MNPLLAATLCLLAFTPAMAIQAADWYVAPTGHDNAPGSLEQPFATVQRAQESANPGDTVYIRGGVFHCPAGQIARTKGIFAYITCLDKSGAPDKPITYCAYQDEHPVFDCSAVKPDGLRVDAFFVSGSWLRLQGLEVTGVQVTIKTHTQSICFENTGSHNLYERLALHDGQAIGIYSTRGSDNLFLNCDAWNNWDYTSEDGKGGNVDGFGCHPAAGGVRNVFRGCRAWFNSDDGYDCINAHEAVTFENCWAFYNGFSTKFERLGDGNGFKAGGYGKVSADKIPATIPRHVVRFCLAVGNLANGIYANHHPDGCDWFNNTAFRNARNFNMVAWDAATQKDIDGHGHKLRNNLSYRSRTLICNLDAARCDSANNSFDLGLSLTDQDFLDIDERELTQPRQANGDLPTIHFLHPSQHSAVIGRGVNIGFPFEGQAPDLGAFPAPHP
jgi:hypothetical protein